MPDDELAAVQSRCEAGPVTARRNDAGLIYLDVTAPAAAARLYLQGAHVTHYQPRGGAPALFTSAVSHYAPGKPIRGGVPIVFPWFGPHPADASLPAHGWARTSLWQLQQAHRDDGGDVTIVLTLGVGELSLKPVDGWALIYTVRVGRALSMELDVQNMGKTPQAFEAALHTYLSVTDVRQVRVEGLDGRDYLDKVDAQTRKAQSGPIQITGETDRVYLDTPDAVTVHDPAAGRRLVIEKTGSATTVVWNPWVNKAKAMPDFGDDEWPKMLCVETANAAENAVTVGPQNSHSMRATVRVE